MEEDTKTGDVNTLWEVRVKRKTANAASLPPLTVRSLRSEVDAARVHDRLVLDEYMTDNQDLDPTKLGLYFFRDRKYEHPAIRRMLERGVKPAWEEAEEFPMSPK